MKHLSGHHLQKTFSDVLKCFFYLAAVSLILLWPSFWNGYPIVFSDTGTYVFSAFNLKVPLDRPLGYGYFIRLFSGGSSLWFVIYAQAFFASLLIWETVRVFFRKNLYAIHFAVMLVLAFFTSLPWFASQLMPDLFTGLIFLILFVFVFGEPGIFERVFLVALLLFFLVTHSANFLLSLGLIVVVALLCFGVKIFEERRRKYLSRLAVLFVATLLAPLFFAVSNSREGYGFVLNPSSYVFMMARVNDAGVLDDYLAEHCASVHYFLCDFRGKLPREDGFIWNRESPVNVAGWQASKAEYENILREIFTTPGFALTFAGDSIVRSAELFFMTGLDPFRPYREDGPVYPQVRQFFPHELLSFTHSRQYAGKFLPVDVFSFIFIVAEIFGMFLFFFLFFRYPKQLETTGKIFVFLAAVFLFLNACVMATLSGAYGRYQERLGWLIVFSFAVVFSGFLLKGSRRS